MKAKTTLEVIFRTSSMFHKKFIFDLEFDHDLEITGAALHRVVKNVNFTSLMLIIELRSKVL